MTQTKDKRIVKLQEFLMLAKQELVRILVLEKIRLNVMVPHNDFLTILTATPNDYGEKELSIKLMLGQGCAGTAWKNRLPVFADLSTEVDIVRDWNIPAMETEKINPNLRSILSIPIYKMSTFDPVTKEGDVVGVLNLDSEKRIDTQSINILETILAVYIDQISIILTEWSHQDV